VPRFVLISVARRIATKSESSDQCVDRVCRIRRGSTSGLHVFQEQSEMRGTLTRLRIHFNLSTRLGSQVEQFWFHLYR
jgi:hypothetical protein